MNTIIKNYKFIIYIILTLLTLTIAWCLTPYININDSLPFSDITPRLLLMLLISFVSIAFFLIQKSKTQYHVENTIEETQQRAEKQKQKQQKIALHQQTLQIFFQLIKTLGGHLTKKYLKLPWYLVLGSPNNGKTTLLTQAGLDLKKLTLQTHTEKQNCQCLTNKKVLFFDTIHFNLNTPFWKAFFSYINLHRFIKPLNGLIITISLSELLLHTENSFQTYRSSFQHLLQQIFNKVKRKMPLYLVFTKCDLITGFQEYFENLKKEFHEKSCSIVFSTQQLTTTEMFTDFFNHKYDQLIANLNEQMLWCLEVEKDPHKRALIMCFPIQMQLFKQAIAELIMHIENWQLHGIYLTSNLQSNHTYDFLMSSVAHKFQLEKAEPVVTSKQEKVYFTKQTLYSILTSDLLYQKLTPLFRQKTQWFTAIVILLISLVGLTTSYHRNQENLTLIQHLLPDYQQSINKLSHPNINVDNLLSSFNVIQQLDDIYTKATAKWLLYFEIYQPYKIHRQITDAWQQLLKKTEIRAQLAQIPWIEFVYYALKTMATDHSFNLHEQLGESSDALFTYQKPFETIPTLYTKTGFNNLYQQSSSTWLHNIANIYKALNLDKTSNSDVLAMQMTPALWLRYNNDYIHAWQTQLDNMHIATFENLSQAINTLNSLLDKQSPLLKALKIIQHNTASIHEQYLTIQQQFKTLNQFTEFAALPNSQYQHTLKDLVAVRNYLIALNNAPDSAQAQFLAARAYMQNSASPLMQLKILARQMPAPLNRWLNEIAENSAGVLLIGARQMLSTIWQNTVYPNYQANIQEKFPFNSKSDTTVSLNNFGDFFGANGTLAIFIKNSLQPFINTTHDTWTLKQVGGHTLGLSSEMLTQLARATFICNTYFTDDNKIPSTYFSIRPRFLNAQTSSVYLQFANQTLLYRHGPQQIANWHWPANGDVQQASITFSDFNGQTHSQMFDGPWGWFQLLSNASLQSTDNNNHIIWTVNMGEQQASFDLWASKPIFNLRVFENFSLSENL